MKKLFTLALACVMSLSACNLTASEDAKIYVRTENAYQCNNHFRVQLDSGDWIDVGSVHGDQQGVFVYASSILQGPDCWEIVQEKTWKCKKCGNSWPVRFQTCPNANCPNEWK